MNNCDKRDLNSRQGGFGGTISHQSNFIACFDAIIKWMGDGYEVDHIYLDSSETFDMASQESSVLKFDSVLLPVRSL